MLLVLALSVAIGGALDMVQTLATVRSLSVLQDQRLLFSRITFFNVGLFGEMLAMAVPLLLAALCQPPFRICAGRSWPCW